MNPLAIAGIIDSLGGALGKLFTSDKDKMAAQLALNNAKIELEKVLQAPAAAQNQVNLEEAKSKSVFVAGWRPFAGWGLTVMFLLTTFYHVIGRQILMLYHLPVLPVDSADLTTILMGMLGLGGYRTYDKLKGTTVTYNPPPGMPDIPKSNLVD